MNAVFLSRVKGLISFDHHHPDLTSFLSLTKLPKSTEPNQATTCPKKKPGHEVYGENALKRKEYWFDSLKSSISANSVH